jgi:signal transduction histidine kinase
MVALTPPVRRFPDRLTGRLWLAICSAVLVTALAVTVALISVGVAPSSQSYTERPLAWGSAGIVVATALVVASWLLVEGHPSSAVGLLLVGLAWLLPGLAAWPVIPAQGRAWLLAAAPVAAVGIGLTVAGWQPTTIDRRGPLFATVGFASLGVAAHLLGYDPFFDPTCARTCEASPAVLAHILGTQGAVGVSAFFTLAASAAAVVTGIRSRAASTSLRSAGVASAMLVALAAVLAWGRWGAANASSAEDLLRTVGTAVLVWAVLIALFRTSQVRRNVRHLVAQLAGLAPTADAGSVATVHFAVPRDGRWVTAAGQLVTSSHPERCVVLSDGHGAAVRLVLGRRADARQVLSSITPAGRLALENARLQAAGLARLADVQASQRRIVEATDLERRRIERDLHDGAQQRLVAVTMQLSSARRRSGAGSAALAEGEARVREALEALRDLSHDSFAEVLYAEGLTAAVEELAAKLALRVDFAAELSDRALPSAVQMAAYVTVAAALDNVVTHARIEHAHVRLQEQGDVLIVRVADGGQGGAVIGRGLTDVADRVGALGGALAVTSRPGQGTEVVARLPCAS